MPAYNSESTILDSVNSVLSQSYQNWELVIVNDGSRDRTLEIVDDISKTEPRIVVLNLTENKGLSNARNQGIAISTGDLIAFLDSDDLWHPQKLEMQLKFHDETPSCKISHTDFEIFNEMGKVKTPFKYFSLLFFKKSGDLFHQLMYTNSIGILTVMMEKRLFNEFKGFDTGMWGMEDQDFWLRISKGGVHFHYINKVLAAYRISPNGMMKNLVKYKLTYKYFIKKHKEIMSRNGTYNMAKAFYYRFFGIHFFETKNYKLSALYFIKSVKQCKKNYFLLITIPYLTASTIYNKYNLFSKKQRQIWL
jgi:teichuronic acid biosynthesis glycosyltransferase TuaG